MPGGRDGAVQGSDRRLSASTAERNLGDITDEVLAMTASLFEQRVVSRRTNSELLAAQRSEG